MRMRMSVRLAAMWHAATVSWTYVGVKNWTWLTSGAAVAGIRNPRQSLLGMRLNACTEMWGSRECRLSNGYRIQIFRDAIFWYGLACIFHGTIYVLSPQVCAGQIKMLLKILSLPGHKILIWLYNIFWQLACDNARRIRKFLPGHLWNYI